MRTELRWGLFLAAALSAWTLLLHVTGVYTTRLALASTLDTVVIVLPAAAVACAMRERRRTGEPFTYLRAFRTGVLTVLISWPFSAAFMLFYHKVINPGWLDRLIAFELGKLREGGATQSVLLATEASLRVRSSVRAELTSSLIGTLLMGVVLSAILAFFFRRRAESIRP
jgi:Protein of unknown function (DUF4199)